MPKTKTSKPDDGIPIVESTSEESTSQNASSQNVPEKPHEILIQSQDTVGQSQDDVMNMFASVWVKIEVEENAMEDEKEEQTVSPRESPIPSDS